MGTMGGDHVKAAPYHGQFVDTGTADLAVAQIPYGITRSHQILCDLLLYYLSCKLVVKGTFAVPFRGWGLYVRNT